MVDGAFHRRVSGIPSHGLGLSVDVYQPDLFELTEALSRHRLSYGYLEMFKASEPALAKVRASLPSARLAYHGEGLWMTQPDWTTAYPFRQELDTAVAHVRTLGSHWMTHECAAKQMAGFSFGTYLPPLFTEDSAEVTAEQVSLVQAHLDRMLGMDAPLLLLEMPPLTYVAFGDMPIPDFFRRVTERSACGLVLDIGHVWTVYRYTEAGRRRPLSSFLAEFLEVFPLERVVQIHVAGLAAHEGGISAGKTAASHDGFPWWIDAHGAPIPDLLWDMLDQVLSHPGLRNLKGMALEVDTKAILQIVAEFRRFRDRFDQRFESLPIPEPRGEAAPCEAGQTGHWDLARPPALDRSELLRQYGLYARTVSSIDDLSLPALGSESDALARYQGTYLPHEILHWGGELADMFPLSCARLAEAGIPLEAFVTWWYREPRPVDGPYDFFLLKLRHFGEFVREVLPREADTAACEAVELKAAYLAVCEDVLACAPVGSRS